MYIKIYKERKSIGQSCPSGNKWILETESSLQKQYNCHIKPCASITPIYIKLKFERYEEAIAYAKANNMAITNSDKPSPAKRQKKNYLENF